MTKKKRTGPRGGTPRTIQDGKRTQVCVCLHNLVIESMDEERCHMSRRIWLETVLCERLGIDPAEIR